MEAEMAKEQRTDKEQELERVLIIGLDPCSWILTADSLSNFLIPGSILGNHHIWITWWVAFRERGSKIEFALRWEF